MFNVESDHCTEYAEFLTKRQVYLIRLSEVPQHYHPPIMTVGHPATMLPPWAVVSPILAAGRPPIITVAEAFTIASGGPAQMQLSPITAAGNLPMSTVGTPGPTTGPPTCGTGGRPGVTIGQACMSVILAAGGIGYLLILKK
jgi:hypothetical protein